MDAKYVIFGEEVSVVFVFGGLAFLAFCLTGLKLRTLLLLTLVMLISPGLDLGDFSRFARLVRWAFIGGLVGKGLLGNVRVGIFPRPMTRAHLAILLLAATTMLSTLWSIGPEVTFALGGSMVAVWVGVFLVVWNSWTTEEDVLDICDALYRLATVLFLLQVAFIVFGLGRYVGADDRYGGVFKNPNGMGTAVAFLGPFVYWKHLSTDSPHVKLWAKALGLIMVVSLLMSGSRSGVLGSVICMGLMIGYTHRARVAIAVCLFGGPLLLFAMIGPGIDQDLLYDSRIVRADSLGSLSDRLPNWEEGFDLFLAKPIAGYGFGMNRFAVVGRADFQLARSALRLLGERNYHNSHLRLALDLGIIGIGLFWYFLFSVFRAGLTLYRSPERGSVRLAAVAYFSAFLALCGDSFVHGWAFSAGSAMALVFYLVSAATLRLGVLTVEADEAAPEVEVGPEPALAGARGVSFS